MYLPPLINSPIVTDEQLLKANSLIGKNLLDYPIFKPIIELGLNGKLDGLKKYCNDNGRDFDKELRANMEIINHNTGPYFIILPLFFLYGDTKDNKALYTMWCELVRNLDFNNDVSISME